MVLMLDYCDLCILVYTVSARAAVTRLYPSLYSRSFDDLKSLQVCDDVIKLSCTKPTFVRYTTCVWCRLLTVILITGQGCVSLLLCLLWPASLFFWDDARDAGHLLPILVQRSI